MATRSLHRVGMSRGRRNVVMATSWVEPRVFTSPLPHPPVRPSVELPCVFLALLRRALRAPKHHRRVACRGAKVVRFLNEPAIFAVVGPELSPPISEVPRDLQASSLHSVEHHQHAGLDSVGAVPKGGTLAEHRDALITVLLRELLAAPFI